MTGQLPFQWLASAIFLCGVLIAWPGQAHPQVSDVFSSSSQDDKLAVGGARKWFENHSPGTKQKANHCLSILDDAKTFQDTALALDAAARQPGLDSHQATALRKQANEQFGLRDKKVRAFIDCFNEAQRQPSPQSDQFASSGDRTPNNRVHTQSPPSPDPDDGGKNIKRVPEQRPTPQGKSQSTAIENAADDCFATSVPNYLGPDWARYARKARPTQPVGQIQRLFDTLGVAADQALDLDEAAYGTWQDRELMRDYLIGWLTHCLTEREVLLKQDPRIPYRRHMEAREPDDSKNPKRITRRFEEFGYGYRSYPLPPFWDHDLAGPPLPAQ